MDEVVILRSAEGAGPSGSGSGLRVAVVVGEIAPKDTSSLLEQLASSFPLHRYSLSHLKRVRRQQGEGGKLELLLCPESEQNELPADLRAKLQSTAIVSVCRVPPLTRAEYEEWNGWWPTNFRPNEVDREREKGHSPEELRTVREFMRLVTQDAERCREFYLSKLPPGHTVDAAGGAGGPDSGGGIVVNPANNRVVASCHDVLLHQDQTIKQAIGGGGGGPTRMQLVVRAPTLLCIEGTALVVNSGVSFSCHATPAPPLPGAQGGAANDADAASPLLPPDAYLCTGLDLYVTHEPNLLSAMALVHSRIRRVFFLEAQPTHGALASRHHIHALRSLNHHYRVFHVHHIQATA